MPTSEYTPDTADVARWLKDRVTTGGGNRVQDFSANTVPTAAEVTGMIADAVDLISVQIGENVPAGAARNAAKKLVAITTAIQIEISFSSKQLGSNKLDELRAMRDDLRKTVDREADKARTAAGDYDSGPGEGAPMPASSFPSNAGGMIGWGNQF